MYRRHPGICVCKGQRTVGIATDHLWRCLQRPPLPNSRDSCIHAETESLALKEAQKRASLQLAYQDLRLLVLLFTSRPYSENLPAFSGPEKIDGLVGPRHPPTPGVTAANKHVGSLIDSTRVRENEP